MRFVLPETERRLSRIGSDRVLDLLYPTGKVRRADSLAKLALNYRKYDISRLS